MAAEAPTPAQFKALVAEVKKNPGNSERHYSEASGIPMPQIGKALYRAELEADPGLKIAATPKAIVAAVKKGTLRWPRIAAYASISVGEAKKLYEQGANEAAPSNITGRGRPFDGNKPAPARGTSGRRDTGKAAPGTSGRRGAGKAAPAATSGRRGSTGGKGKQQTGRRGTRAGASPS